MAELTYRDAVIRGIAQEMKRDPDVVFLGEDVAKAGGVFKATVGLYEQFGPLRVRDTPISEQAILGAAMGAAMTGLKPIAEIMFSDFFAVCFDYIANEFPKSRYMSNGQTKCPLVVRTGNGAGSRFGAQHSQSVENWCMMIPGLKVVAPSSPVDVIGLLAASVRDPDPVIFLEHKSLYATKGEVPDGEIVDTLGTAKILRPGKDATICALALMVPRALQAAEKLKAEHGIDCEVVDVRSLVPLDTQTILGSVAKTHRLFTVEENPRLCGWGAEIVSIVADEAFYDLDGPPVRITTPHIPLPAADILEDIVADARSPRCGDEQRRSPQALSKNYAGIGDQSHVRKSPGQCSHRPLDWRQMAESVRRRSFRRDRSGDREEDRVGRERLGRGREGRGRRRRRGASKAGPAASRASAPRSCARPIELIMRDAERFAKLITLENGKALSDSRGEVAYAAEFFRWYAEEAVRNHRPDFALRRRRARASLCSTSRPALPCW